MQLRKVFALAIYMGSYLPLSLILLAQDIDFEVVRRGPCPTGTMVSLGCSSPLRDTVLSLSALGVCALYQDSLIRTHGPNCEGRWT
jgi:hypothetical protein